MPPSAPSTLAPLHRALIERAVDQLCADPRIVGVAAAGSYAQDAMDEFSDVDLVVEGDQRFPNSPTLSPGALKPVYAPYMADRRGNGTTPVVFADGHVRAYSANALNTFGTVIWRFR